MKDHLSLLVIVLNLIEDFTGVTPNETKELPTWRDFRDIFMRNMPCQIIVQGGGQNLQAVQLPLGSERPDGHCHTTRADSQSGGNIQTTGSSPSLGHSRKKPRGHQGKPRGFPPQGVRKPIQKSRPHKCARIFFVGKTLQIIDTTPPPCYNLSVNLS